MQQSSQQQQSNSILHQQLVSESLSYPASAAPSSGHGTISAGALAGGNYGRTVSVSSTESEYFEGASPAGSENEVEVHTTTSSCGGGGGDEGMGPAFAGGGGAMGVTVGSGGGASMLEGGGGSQDARYWERRRKNNLAAKKSRDARRVRENQLRIKVLCLENANHVLRAQVTQEREENSALRERIRLLEESAAAGASGPVASTSTSAAGSAPRRPSRPPSATATPMSTPMEQETEEEDEENEVEALGRGTDQSRERNKT